VVVFLRQTVISSDYFVETSSARELHGRICYHSILLFQSNDFMAVIPQPTDIRLHQASRLLEIHFDNGTECMLSCEFLRVHSPSAEVRGHGAGQEVLQIGKEDVNITAIEPVGNYAVKLTFSDGHDTGLYSWDYLYYLAGHYEPMWMDYLARLEAAGHKRKIVA
jgi:DUF971 family protein